MNSNLESFRPRLRPGRVIPQGSRIIFETDNPYNQIVLPMVMADFVLLCSGKFTIRQIVDKIYQKQRSVPFRWILSAIHSLHQGDFFENGHELVLSSHLEAWIQPARQSRHLSWRFGQRIVSNSNSPAAFYILTLLALVGSIVGLQYFPTPQQLTTLLPLGENFLFSLFSVLCCTAAIQTVRYLFCAVQLLLLSGKAYNVSLRLNLWGPHLHVGDEAIHLVENRLYHAMFHISQLLVGWLVVWMSAYFYPQYLPTFIAAASLVTIWEINPFARSEGRKLVRTLMLPSDQAMAFWHFESSPLMRSIDPTLHKHDMRFYRVRMAWGAAWLMFATMVLIRLSQQHGPAVISHIARPSLEAVPYWMQLAIWLFAFYLVVQTSIEAVMAPTIKRIWQAVHFKWRAARALNLEEFSVPKLAESLQYLPLFSHFDENHIQQILKHSSVMRFDPGTILVQEGDVARDLYILLEGEVEIIRNTLNEREWVTELASVSIFGEAALLDDAPRSAEVRSKTTVIVLKVPVEVIRKSAQESQTIRYLEDFRNAILVNQYFASSPVFRSLSGMSIEFLSSRGAVEYFDQGQTIFNQGDTGDSLYMILRGSVDVEIHGKYIKRLKQGSFFGEIALIANIPRTATVYTAEPSAFFKISADSFWEVLVNHIDVGVFIETISENRLREDLEVTPLKPTGSDPI